MKVLPLLTPSSQSDLSPWSDQPAIELRLKNVNCEFLSRTVSLLLLRAGQSFLILWLVPAFAFTSPATAAVPAAPPATPAAISAPAGLGPGLAFLRLAALDVEVAAKMSASSTALVLDLRGTTADEQSAVTFLAMLRARPANQGVCLILISPATAPALLKMLVTRVSGCLTIGRAEGNCRPDIAVTTTAESDQRAQDALGTGTPPLALLGPTVDKPRHDEAELAKDHASGKKPASEPASPDSTAPKPAASPAAGSLPAVITATLSTVLPPPLDAVLQRAVQIHRGLLALVPPATR